MRASITLPRPTDQLWIVTDGSVTRHGIGTTLYVSRDNKIHLAGFFSAKLRKHQVAWLPCEVEALSIATAIKHFSPFIIQSTQQPSLLTDSKPCVQAFEKLCRGELSASVLPHSCLLLVGARSIFVSSLDLQTFLQISPAETPQNVTSQDLKSVASSFSPKTLLFVI